MRRWTTSHGGGRRTGAGELDGKKTAGRPAGRYDSKAELRDEKTRGNVSEKNY